MTRVERFSAGERLAVDPNAIERELSEVWREAGRSTDGRRPVTRACLWNVIACLDEREGANGTEWLESLIRHLPEYLAARALVLRVRPQAEGEPPLQSWISANCILASGGGKLVCSEEVSLESRGEGWRHLPALCRALLVPGVPTAVVFGRVPLADDPLTDELVQASDKTVVWADRCGRSHPFDLVRDLAEERELVDLGWTRQADLRAAIGALFDGGESEINRLQEIVVGGGTRRQSGLLLFGWIAARLGATAVKGSGLAGAGLELQTPRGPVRVRWQAGEEDGYVQFMGMDVDRRVTREASGVLRLQRPSGCRRWTGRAEPEPALLARALLHRSCDPELDSALQWAERMDR